MAAWAWTGDHDRSLPYRPVRERPATMTLTITTAAKRPELVDGISGYATTCGDRDRRLSR
ncbi:MAG TPA: hypothetical protein DEQ61_19690 [Streptomyces sp.]|nr:hypothetical protein [Streptomyces sp.]